MILKIFTIIGLIADLIGAGIIAYSVLSIDSKEIIDSIGYKVNNPVPKNVYLLLAKKSLKKCKEKYYTTLGFMIICSGLIIQLYDTYTLANPSKISITRLKIYGFILSIILIALSYLMSKLIYTKIKQDTVIELCNRITDSTLGRNYGVNMPANEPIETFGDIMNIFEPLEFLLSKFGEEGKSQHTRLINIALSKKTT